MEARQLFAFGLTSVGNNYVVDTGGGLTFSILKGGTLSSTVHLGDMTSAKLNGTELLAAYSANANEAGTARYAHYEQGLSSATTITTQVTSDWIKVTCDDSNTAAGGSGIVHWYVARKGENTIYMASLPNDVNASPGEGRYIAYLKRPVFTNIEQPSDISGNVGAVEGSDVFRQADGTTNSKFYNTRRMIDNEVHGVAGTLANGGPVGAFMFMGNREHSAGGPFFKDIDFQTTGAATEIYNCLFTGHTQTEPFRQGLQGPYALQFTGAATPTPPDYTFLEGVGITGLVPASGRGSVDGVASGNPAGHPTIVTLTNASAQYWDAADAEGRFSIPGVLPGTYTQTLYDDELAVATRTITVSAGATTHADIRNRTIAPLTTWRIGTWDGTPGGFLNADKIAVMHPSDVRMSPWTNNGNFIVGTSADGAWPMTQFMDVNNAQRITFTLTAAQAATPQTLRIGMTLGFEGGRNRITVNAGQGYAWTSGIPAASADLNSRGITRGTYRGPNQLYTFNIPTSALRAGVNTIDLPVVSGSYVAGQGFLSPSVTYDAIDLVATSSLKQTRYLADDGVGATSLTDSSGNRNHATLTGSYAFADTSDPRGGGTLNLSGGYASLPSGIVAGLNDFTIAAWIKPDALDAWARIFDFGSGTNAYMFLSPRNGQTNTLRFAITTSGGAGEQQLNGPALPIGQWTHVAVTLSGNTATLYVNGLAVATNSAMTIHPASLGNTTQNFLGKSQFASDPAYRGSIDDFRLLARAMSASEIATVADVTAPTFAGTFAFQTTQAIRLSFSEQVFSSLSGDDATIQNLTTGQTTPAGTFTFAMQSAAGTATVATWTRDPAAGVLPDGNYRVTLPAGAIADAAGNVNASPMTFDFFVLAGDLDRDRDVDFADLLTLAKNYGQSGRTFGEGNVDYSADGSVGFSDLLILAKHYGMALPATVQSVLVSASPTRRRSVTVDRLI